MDYVNYPQEKVPYHPDAKPQGDARNKGKGYYGELKRPDGGISTELSSSGTFGGREMEFPLIVPTLTKEELDILLSGGTPTKEIYRKASQYAFERMKRGMSPFAQPNEWGKSEIR